MVDDGRLVVDEHFLPTSNRRFALAGTKDEQPAEEQPEQK
jgi:hypothetical protein